MSNSLYIDRKGVTLKLQNGALLFYENNERIATVPLAPIDRIYLYGDVTLTATILAKLGELGIGVICLSGRKHQPTLLMAKPHNDAARRINQYKLSLNQNFCLDFSKKIVKLKLITEKNFIQSIIEKCPLRRGDLLNNKQKIEDFIKKVPEQNSIDSLRGIEGWGAYLHFQSIQYYLPSSLNFRGRNRRPPRDPFNAILSLGYTLLHSQVVLGLYGSGLDPYIGFYHQLDYSRESLACDVVELFRALYDAWSVDCFKSRILRVEDFSETSNGCFLGKAWRVRFYSAFEQAKEQWQTLITHTCEEVARLIKQVDDSDDYHIALESFFLNQLSMLAPEE